MLSGHIHRHQILTGAHPPVIFPGSIERTSFAEMCEIKGFLELHVHSTDRGVGVETIFHRLPTRAMADIVLHEWLVPSTLDAYLEAEVSALDDDAIVRLKCAGIPSRAILRLLSREHLERIFPVTMNVQLSSSLFARQ